MNGEHRLRMQATLDAHLDAQWLLPAAPLIAKSLTQSLQLQLLRPSAIESTIAAPAPFPAVTAVASPPTVDATSPSTIRSPPATGFPSMSHFPFFLRFCTALKRDALSFVTCSTKWKYSSDSA